MAPIKLELGEINLAQIKVIFGFSYTQNVFCLVVFLNPREVPSTKKCHHTYVTTTLVHFDLVMYEIHLYLNKITKL